MAEVKTTDEQVRVFVWCVPRSASTILAKCMSAIEGNVVWLSPYTYSDRIMKLYHRSSGKDLPIEYHGNEDSYAEAVEMNKAFFQNCKVYPERLSYPSIKKDLEAATSKFVFVKDMGSVINQHRGYLPTGFKHTFLIRDPSRVFVSFRKGMSKTLREQGLISNESIFDMIKDDFFNIKPNNVFKDLHAFWKYARDNIDPNPTVIDAYDLLSKPDQTLRAYCKTIGLPYSESLLKWSPSVDESKGWRTAGEGLLDGIKDFYSTAMQSTHFIAPRESGAIPRDHLTDDVIRCVDESMPYYTEMYQTRLQV